MHQARRQHRAPRRSANAASMRGLQAAMAELYAPHEPMSADAEAQQLRVLQEAPYRKRQRELALVLPEPESR